MNTEIIILRNVLTPVFQRATVYYRDGNIYQPLYVHGLHAGRVRSAINKFVKENREMIKADRAKPGFKSLSQLAEEQLS